MSCGAKLRNSKCYILKTADAIELKTFNEIYIKDVRDLEILDFSENQEYFQFFWWGQGTLGGSRLWRSKSALPPTFQVRTST